MEDFWKSVQTIQAERGADYRAFSLFSATHWAELLGAAAVIFLCAVIYYRCREVTRHQILRAVFVLMLADEFMKQAVLLYTGQWNVTYLPLHLCSSADPLSGPSACWRISPAGASYPLGTGVSVCNRNADLFPESAAENKLFLSQ